MSSSLLLQQCPACLVRLIWMVVEMGGKCTYSCYFLGCCFVDIFNIAHCILVLYTSSNFSLRFVNVHVVHPYRRIDTTTAWKKLHFILSDNPDYYMIDSLLTEFHAFASSNLMSFSVDKTLLSRYVNLSTSFREPPFHIVMPLF